MRISPMLYSFLFVHANCQHLKKADPSELRKIFEQFATETDRNGEKVISNENYIRKFIGLYEDENYNRESVNFIATIVDVNRDGHISFDEFMDFEKLLHSPDALYRTAFRFFRRSNNDSVTYDDFVEVVERTVLHKKVPFDFDSDFISLYFGEDKKRVLVYEDFGQFLQDYLDTYALIAFKKYNKDGFIDVTDFRDIMLSVKSHLVNDVMRTKVINSKSFPVGRDRISYSYYCAFNSLLNNMELFKRIYLYATNGKKTVPVSKKKFLEASHMISQITPLEIDILYSICDLMHQANGHIVYDHLRQITPEQYYRRVKQSFTEYKAVSSPDERSFFIQFLENAYRFFLGAMAGCVGSATVYPIDFVKTRIQNQRLGPNGELMYTGYLDCLKKVVANEGVRGLYKGLATQLCGVAPEKAIKLSAGCCQVIVTNPLEIVKIRLQMAGQQAKGKTVTAFQVIKDLGFLGLYRGHRACILRDSSFSSIYFPTYNFVKSKLVDENGYNNPFTLLVSGAIAGMPAASLVTPFDVIKTRLQVIPQKGETEYHGLIDAIKKIHREEGVKAFWKGTLARVLRSSPQFGVTLATYEILQRLFYIDFGGSRPAGSELHVMTAISVEARKPHHIGGYQVALPVLTGLETKFGIALPRFSYPNKD